MLPDTLKADSNCQDENDEMDAVGLYSHNECYVTNAIPHGVDINTLHHNFMLCI